jgi:hypothetical protein
VALSFRETEHRLKVNRVAAAWLADNLPDLDIAPPQIAAGEAVLNL